LPIGCLNKKGTFKTRLKEGRKTMVFAHSGPMSPMTGVEAHLIKCLLLHGTLIQPVSCAENLQLVNSLIEGTVLYHNRSTGATTTEQEPEAAAVSLDADDVVLNADGVALDAAFALEDTDMAMEPTNGGLEEATPNGL
jgi:hypothetical protein